MRRADENIPLSVLTQAMAVAAVVGIPVFFVAFSQIRRACGGIVFGSRQHFCTGSELWNWVLSLPLWIDGIFLLATFAGALAARWALRRIAS